MLDIQRISKTFNPGTVNEKCALHELSLSVPDGDFITIIGARTATWASLGLECVGLLGVVVMLWVYNRSQK